MKISEHRNQIRSLEKNLNKVSNFLAIASAGILITISKPAYQHHEELVKLRDTYSDKKIIQNLNREIRGNLSFFSLSLLFSGLMGYGSLKNYKKSRELRNQYPIYFQDPKN